MPDQTSGPYGEYELPGHPPPPGRVPTWPLSAEDEAAVIDAMNSAPRPLAVRCRACLALILNGLAALHPADVEQQAAYVHSRRVWYPTPPTEETR